VECVLTDFEVAEEATEEATKDNKDCFDEDADATSIADFGDVGILFFGGDE
jgi:hypothetical protein